MVTLGILTAIGLGQPTELTGAVISSVVQGLYERFQDQKHHGLDIEVKEAWTISARQCADQYSPGAEDTLKKRKFFIALQTYGEELPHEKVDRDLVRALAIGDKDDYTATITACAARVIEDYEQANPTKQHFTKEEWYSKLLNVFAGVLLYTFLQVIKQSSHEKGFKDFLRYNLGALKANDQIHAEMLDEILDKLENMTPGGGDWLKVCEFIEGQNSEVISAVELVGISIGEFRAEIARQFDLSFSRLEQVEGKVEGVTVLIQERLFKTQDQLDETKEKFQIALQENYALKDEIIQVKQAEAHAIATGASNAEFLTKKVDELEAQLEENLVYTKKLKSERWGDFSEDIRAEADKLDAEGKETEAKALFERLEHPFVQMKMAEVAFELDKTRIEEALRVWYKAKPSANTKQLLQMARTFHEFAYVLLQQGSYFVSVPIQVESLEIMEHVLGPRNPEILAAMNNLALLYNGQGNYREAENLHIKTLDLSKELNGIKHPETINIMNNLAMVLADQGRLEEAEQLCRSALQLRLQVLGEKDPQTLISMSNLAMLLVDQGKFDEGEQMHEKSYQLRQEVIGREHKDTLQSMNNLALLYLNTGRVLESKDLFDRTLTLSEKVNGEQHPYTLTTMSNVSEVYRRLGRIGEAEELSLKILEISIRVLGNDHPDTLRCKNNLALLHHKKGNLEESGNWYVELLETSRRTLGDRHPHSLGIMVNLAALQREKGEMPNFTATIKEAERLSGHLDDKVPIRAAILSWFKQLG